MVRTYNCTHNDTVLFSKFDPHIFIQAADSKNKILFHKISHNVMMADHMINIIESDIK